MANVKTGAISCGTFPSDRVVRFVIDDDSGTYHIPIATETEDRVRKRVAALSSLTRDRRKRLDTREVNPASLIAFMEPSIEVVMPKNDQYISFTHLTQSWTLTNPGLDLLDPKHLE
jgi:hypothetical protein